MIMEESVLKSWKQAGQLAAEALRYGTKLMKPEAPIAEVLDQVEEYIIKRGGGIAFPAQSSINEYAAHSCPENNEAKYKMGDVAKLDVGAHVDGYVADNATTVEIGGGKIHSELIAASREALNAAIKELKPGANTANIGAAIQRTIQEKGYHPIVNLSGHGIGKWIVHAPPSFPNYNTGRGAILKEDMAFAIEPFATPGEGRVADSGNPTVFMQESRKPVRSAYAREVLSTIDTYNGLPFTTRWLTKKHGVKTKLALSELQRAGIIHSYPPLADVGKGLVSQAEHCFILKEKPIVLTQLEDWP
jgi:methionyl aminopeptidase